MGTSFFFSGLKKFVNNAARPRSTIGPEFHSTISSTHWGSPKRKTKMKLGTTTVTISEAW